ncbi:hypothetical protein N9L68_08235 [bacterium]|nr:hypothetical protein [bacterium]
MHQRARGVGPALREPPGLELTRDVETVTPYPCGQPRRGVREEMTNGSDLRAREDKRQRRRRPQHTRRQRTVDRVVRPGPGGDRPSG